MSIYVGRGLFVDVEFRSSAEVGEGEVRGSLNTTVKLFAGIATVCRAKPALFAAAATSPGRAH